jgi:hypothetical protein
MTGCLGATSGPTLALFGRVVKRRAGAETAPAGEPYQLLADCVRFAVESA